MRKPGKWARTMVPMAALGTLLALGPTGAAIAAVRPAGEARNVALRDGCGGANSNINWNSSGVSTWGQVWGDCAGGNAIDLYYGKSTNLRDDDVWAASVDGTEGFNSGTLHFSGLSFVAEAVCGTSGCSDLYTFAS